MTSLTKVVLLIPEILLLATKLFSSYLLDYPMIYLYMLMKSFEASNNPSVFVLSSFPNSIPNKLSKLLYEHVLIFTLLLTMVLLLIKFILLNDLIPIYLSRHSCDSSSSTKLSLIIHPEVIPTP